MPGQRVKEGQNQQNPVAGWMDGQAKVSGVSSLGAGGGDVIVLGQDKKGGLYGTLVSPAGPKIQAWD